MMTIVRRPSPWSRRLVVRMSIVALICAFSSLLPKARADTEMMTSHPSEFEFGPANTTTVLGAISVLKCKIKKRVKSCYWFYLAEGSSSPKLVKVYPPKSDRDCSMVLKNAKMEQKGQWVCKVLLEGTNNEVIISQPAFVNIVAQSDNPDILGERDLQPNSNEEHGENATDNRHYPFIKSDETHIINAHIGDRTRLRCQTATPMQNCDWMRPGGLKLSDDDEDVKRDYEIRGNLSAGECVLTVHFVRAIDEGNWRCTVILKDMLGELLSPATHLHVLELGINPHPTDKDFETILSTRHSTLVVILVSTSLVLLLLVIALIAFFVQRKAWRRQPNHKYIETHRDGTSEYSGYGPWVSEMGVPKDPELLSDRSSLNYNGGYLDMSGRSSGRAQQYPESSLQAAMSIRTLGPAPSIPIGAINLRMNKSEVNVNSSTFGNPTFDRSDATDDRKASVYSNNHLYEELDQFARSRLHPDEDTEGYMVPNRRERLPTPPPPLENSYNNISEPNPERDSGFDPADIIEDPDAPSVPTRTDSQIDSPLANYDVPRKSQEHLDHV